MLKVGNHGENDATSEALLKAVNPEIAIISTNTAEEPDTPDPKVLALLRYSGAKVFQTQEAQSGVLVTIDQGGVTAQHMGYAELPSKASGVSISQVDNEDDLIILRNNGKAAVDMGGWYILSDKGNQMYVLPKGTMIAPGGELVIGSQSTKGKADLTWPDKKVWHKEKEDAAYLYDVYGRLMDELK